MCQFLAIACKRKYASSMFLLFSIDWMQITPLPLPPPPTPNYLRLGGITGWSHCEEQLHPSAGNIRLVFFTFEKNSLFIYIIFGCAESLLLHRLFSSCTQQGSLSSYCTQASRCRGFSGAWALEHRLNSCGAQAWLLCSMWAFPGSGIEPIPVSYIGRQILYHGSHRGSLTLYSYFNKK